MDVRMSPGLSDDDYALIFSPLSIGGVALENRIVRTAHGTGLSRGLVTDDLIEYHRLRARGGAALIFAEGGQVHWSSPGFLDLSSDDVLPGLSRLGEAVHAEGTKIFQQLAHGGATVVPHDGGAPWAASVTVDPRLGLASVSLTQHMIDEIVECFSAAAARAERAGLDGIEIHAGHNYLFSSFLSPATNGRTDTYGGSLANRARLLIEVLTAVRAATEQPFAVGVRLSADGPADQTTNEDLVQVAGWLEERGLIDFVNASYGSHYLQYKNIGSGIEERRYMVPLVRPLSRSTTLPTIVTGRILTLVDAAQILRDGDADLISMVRAMIAEPDLVVKARSGQAASIRPCISCNQACVGGLNTQGKLGCVVNVGAGRELHTGDTQWGGPAARPLTVVVVGGGPAGLEAARVSAIKGHRVILAETSSNLGGQLRLAGRSASRPDMSRLIPYYEAEVARLGVDVRLGCHIEGPSDTDALGADIVVVAAGARPRRDGFQAWLPARPPVGLSTVPVLTGWDVLIDPPGQGPVLVVDDTGHYESLDVIDTLLQAGLAVHHVSRFHAVGAQLPVSYEYVGAAYQKRFLDTDRYRQSFRAMVTSVAPGHARVAQIDSPRHHTDVEARAFVFLSGSLPDPALTAAFAGIKNVVTIGDALAPRMLQAAIFEGATAIQTINPDYVRPQWIRYQSGSSV
jgi:2,4-dienoyl-CoA reductase-like NADH-dependent reductase (Old Yellow Enzyme family)